MRCHINGRQRINLFSGTSYNQDIIAEKGTQKRCYNCIGYDSLRLSLLRSDYRLWPGPWHDMKSCHGNVKFVSKAYGQSIYRKCTTNSKTRTKQNHFNKIKESHEISNIWFIKRKKKQLSETQKKDNFEKSDIANFFIQ